MATNHMKRRNSTVRRDGDYPLFDAEAVRAQLQLYDRTPFIDLLVTWMKNAPSEADILLFAHKAPGLYVAALAQLGRLSGFTEKTETTTTHIHDLRRISDAELEERLKAVQEHLKAPLTIDAKALPLGASKPKSSTNL